MSSTLSFQCTCTATFVSRDGLDVHLQYEQTRRLQDKELKLRIEQRFEQYLSHSRVEDEDVANRDDRLSELQKHKDDEGYHCAYEGCQFEPVKKLAPLREHYGTLDGRRIKWTKVAYHFFPPATQVDQCAPLLYSLSKWDGPKGATDESTTQNQACPATRNDRDKLRTAHFRPDEKQHDSFPTECTEMVRDPPRFRVITGRDSGLACF
ncbi:hypothetical protein TruAng_012026 [Truncatella angustata]|nr:hypothetical protein TruAng_012026 [Truncatella angustata]